MSYQPVLPFGGLTGWRFLQRTQESQTSAYAESAPQKRLTDYFREKINDVTSAEDLVKDRRLLTVALTAFGLESDINSKAFIRKILDDGTLDPEALGNKLSDKRYLALAKAFGFGDFDTPNTVLSTFADDIISKFDKASFQVAVGEQNNEMRLVLNLGNELSSILESTTSENARWYAVMGSAPLRTVFETALGFPSGFSQLDVDKQLDAFKGRSERLFGTDKLGDFVDPDTQDKLIRTFVIRAEAANSAATSSGAIAVTLLQNAASIYRKG